MKTTEKSNFTVLVLLLVLYTTILMPGCSKPDPDPVKENQTTTINENSTQLSSTKIPTIIQTQGSWQSAAEARNMPITPTVLDALYTLISNNSSVTGVVKTSTYVKYLTGYKDEVYFVLPGNNLSGRVFTVSRLPVYNTGMIRRLDNNLKEAARFLSKSVLSSHDREIFELFAGYTGKFYYTQEEGAFCRVYIDQRSSLTSTGNLIKPDNSNELTFRSGSYKQSGCAISFSMQNVQKFSKSIFEDADGFLLCDFMDESTQPGTYTYVVSYREITWLNAAIPNSQRKYWVECAGKNMKVPLELDVTGSSQPRLQSRIIAELVMP